MIETPALAVDATDSQVTDSGGSSAGGKLSAYLELGKVRLSALAIFAVVAGYLFATPTPDWAILAVTALSTMFVAMGGNAINMYYERHLDAKMDRTKGRPIQTGRLTPREVLTFGWVIACVGLVVLALATNLVATSVCVLIFVSYVWIYTPLKVKTTLNTLVGAVPGALPPVVGYAAAGADLDIRALVLFSIVFFWQVPHFLAIAWRYREDYTRGGYKMVSCADPSGRTTSLQILLYTLAMFAATVLPYSMGMAGEIYFFSMIGLNLMFFVPVCLAAMYRKESAMTATFKVSLVYLPFLLIALVFDSVTVSS